MKDLFEVDDNNFEKEVKNSHVPVMIDIYSDSCMPCKILYPILKELNEKFSDKLKICKANMELNSTLISKYKISSVPTILFLNNGDMVKKITGLRNKMFLEKSIEEIL